MEFDTDRKCKEKLEGGWAGAFKCIRAFNIHLYPEQFGEHGREYLNVQKELEQVEKDIKFIKWKIEHGKKAITDYKNREPLTALVEENNRAVMEMLNPNREVIELTKEQEQELFDNAVYKDYLFRMLRERDNGDGDYIAQLERLEQRKEALVRRENELYILGSRLIIGDFRQNECI